MDNQHTLDIARAARVTLLGLGVRESLSNRRSLRGSEAILCFSTLAACKVVLQVIDDVGSLVLGVECMKFGFQIRKFRVL